MQLRVVKLSLKMCFWNKKCLHEPQRRIILAPLDTHRFYFTYYFDLLAHLYAYFVQLKNSIKSLFCYFIKQFSQAFQVFYVRVEAQCDENISYTNKTD